METPIDENWKFSRNNSVYDPKKNYSGQKFCHLLVVKPVEISSSGENLLYDCTCLACGKEHVLVRGEEFFYYRVRSCGVCTPFRDILDGWFSRLHVVKYIGVNNKRTRLFECECQCGKHIVVTSNALLTRHSKSCGCQRIASATRFEDEVDKKISRRLTIIKQRCYNSNDKAFKLWYGSKGIQICQEWLDDTNSFIRWFKSQPNWSTDLEVDRIDGKKGYSPENCRLVTRETQLINRSVSHFIEVDGITMTGSRWSNLLKLPHRCSIYSFMYYNGIAKTKELIRRKMKEFGICRENLSDFITFECFDPLEKRKDAD